MGKIICALIVACVAAIFALTLVPNTETQSATSRAQQFKVIAEQMTKAPSHVRLLNHTRTLGRAEADVELAMRTHLLLQNFRTEVKHLTLTRTYQGRDFVVICNEKGELIEGYERKAGDETAPKELHWFKGIDQKKAQNAQDTDTLFSLYEGILQMRLQEVLRLFDPPM